MPLSSRSASASRNSVSEYDVDRTVVTLETKDDELLSAEADEPGCETSPVSGELRWDTPRNDSVDSDDMVNQQISPGSLSILRTARASSCFKRGISTQSAIPKVGCEDDCQWFRWLNAPLLLSV